MTETSSDERPRRRPGRPRRADAGDTKDHLVRAALQLFARQGFAGTSIRAIAREVGFSESVLYAHFSGKQALFEAVLATYGPQRPVDLLTEFESGLAESDPPAFLREMVGAFLDVWERREHRLLISLMAREGLLQGDALQPALAGMRDEVAVLFERWTAAGQVPEHLGTPQNLAFSFTGPIGLARILHLHADASPEERSTARESVLQHVDLFARAVFGRAGESDLDQCRCQIP